MLLAAAVLSALTSCGGDTSEKSPAGALAGADAAAQDTSPGASPPDTLPPDTPAADAGQPAPRVEPASGPSSGYYAVELNLHDTGIEAAEVTGVTFAGIAAYDLTPLGGGRLRVTVQGSPAPGPAEVSVRHGGETTSLGEPFTYEAPASPRFARFVAIGASLTQGVQRGTPSFHGGLFAPSALIARQAGAFHGLPLLVPDLFPQIGLEDIGHPPECAPPNVATFVTDAATEIFALLQDPETGELCYCVARVDPDIEVRNLGVGNSNLGDVVHGPTENFGAVFLTPLVYDPYAELMGKVAQSQLDVLEELEPTLVMSTDLYGNDIIGAIINTSADILPEKMTPLESMEADLDELLERLAATGADVFIATLPRPSLLPATATKRAQMAAAGKDPTAAIAEVDARALAVNDALVLRAAAYETVHVVDIATAVAELEGTAGLDVAGQLLTVSKFGGLLGLDGVHFTDAGYAFLANHFIQAMNEALGTEVPPLDLAPIVEADMESPDALAAAGLPIGACE